MKEKLMKRIMITIILAAVATLGVANAADNDRPCGSRLAPYNLTAVGTESDEIHLKWRPGDSTRVGFDIERSPDGIVWERINVGYPKGHYNDTYDLHPLTTYFYRVRVSPRAEGHPCASAYSNTAMGTTTANDPDGK
jgi:hypothetical protein